jgi:tRNA(fMet)-specific endonuclease VapC
VYLVDTDVVASYLKGRDDAVALLSSLLSAGLAISVVTFGEVFEGIYFGRDPSKHAAEFRRFLHGARVLDVNRGVARRFARIRGDLRQRGQLIGDPDLLIAATALHYDLELLTRNLRHFQRIPELKVFPPQP